MTAEAIAKALGAHRAGAAWMAKCPAHDDRCPSFSISEGQHGKVLVHCHAGCSQREVIAALVDHGIWDATVKNTGRFSPASCNRVVIEPDLDATARSDAALTIWRASQPADGTLVEIYLRSRGLTVPVPPNLRFHPRLKHPSGGVWPVMVGLVTRGATGLPIAIHRTYLARRPWKSTSRSGKNDAGTVSWWRRETC